jgi:hypothetical protein
VEYALVLNRLLVAIKKASGKKDAYNAIKDVLPKSKSVLYKKVNGDVMFTLTEVLELCKAYNIALDSIGFFGDNHLQEKNLDIHPMPLVYTFDDLISYLTDTSTRLEIIRQTPDAELTLSARDIPYFLYFKDELLAAFRCLAWIHRAYENRYSIKDIPQELLTVCNNLYKTYWQTKRTEIWSVHTLTNTIENLKYMHQIGLIKTKQVADCILMLKDVLNDQKESILSNEGEKENTLNMLFSPSLNMYNGALVSLRDEEFALMSISALQTIVVKDKSMLPYIKRSFSFQRKHSTNFTHSSPAIVENYFNGLNTQLDELLLKLKSEN